MHIVTIFLLIGEPWWMLYLLLLSNSFDPCVQLAQYKILQAIHYTTFIRKVINRPAILTPVCSETVYLCYVRTGVKEHYVFLLLSEFPILIVLEPFLERDIFVCAPRIPDCITKLEMMNIIPRS